MGLDLEVLGRAKPGHEEEWQRLMQKLYNGRELSDEEAERGSNISIPDYASIGAPRVGEDPAADAWMLERKPDDSPLSDEEFLREMKGYYVVSLLLGKCDGVPRYSHGDINPELEATSFRGKFISDCEGLLDDDLRTRCFTQTMRPEEAIDYGKALLASADNPWVEPPPYQPPPPPRTLLDWLLGRWPEPPEPEPPATAEEIEEEREMLRAAGRWYIFWGERGHPIWAWW